MCQEYSDSGYLLWHMLKKQEAPLVQRASRYLQIAQRHDRHRLGVMVRQRRARIRMGMSKAITIILIILSSSQGKRAVTIIDQVEVGPGMLRIFLKGDTLRRVRNE